MTALGPLMIDLEGTTISEEEKELLCHPLVGGVILFSRNFESKAQIANICTQIHALRTPTLLIAVDHEGGRVQRFKEGFQHLPAMAEFAPYFATDPQVTLGHCQQLGWLMAAELLDVGIDFSFAPILDIECGLSEVIGDRAFGTTPETVTTLAKAWIAGMHQAGMAATGKHFPGHGSVKEDSHIAIPVDNRSWEEISQHDLRPFQDVIASGLEGIMPAHVYYPQVDAKMPAGFSQHWLQTVLRQQLNFDGVIFSDDLSMAGAAEIGDFPTRAHTALEAGCDMVLVCNHRPAAIEVIEALQGYQYPEKSRQRLTLMHGKFSQARDSQHYQLAQDSMAALSKTA